jgi:hypothetical protein
MIPYVEPRMKMEVDDNMPSKLSKESKDDMLVNNLIYRQPVDLSLAKSRTHVKQFFQRSDYKNAGGQTAICDWNTGSSYINVANSFLVFNIKLSSANTVNRAYTYGADGSAMNAINRIMIRTKSGSEIDRVDYVPLWSRTDTQYNCTKDYRDTVMSMAGYGNSYLVSIPTLDVPAYKVAIPLERLAPIFNPLKKQLMPPQLASGLHIEFVFEQLGTVFSTNNLSLDTPTYDITNLHFLLDQVDLSDEAQKAIAVESAETGLEWVTPRVYSLQTSLASGVTTANVQIRKAVTQATRAWTVVQNPFVATAVANDSVASLDQPFYVKWQYNLGSLYFPNQEVVDDNPTTPVSSMIEALYAFDKTKDGSLGCRVTSNEFSQGSAIYAMTANRDDDLFLSGLNINNSRALQFKFEAQWEPSDQNLAHLLTSFLEYIQVVKCYSDQSVVSI